MADIKQLYTIKHVGSHVFSLRFTEEGTVLAAGCDDGSVKLYDVRDGERKFTLGVPDAGAMAATALRFRPSASSVATKNVLLVGDGDGHVTHWHYPSRKVLSKFTEADNSVQTVAYAPDGASFATAGKDRVVRVYDEDTKAPIVAMGSTLLEAAAGHANRVFASAWVPGDAHTLLTGGWDNTVHVWDTRSGRSERKIFGPHIAGDALDVRGERVLTGSWRPEDPLQVWDLGSGKVLATAPYNGGGGEEALATYTAGTAPGLVYGATFSADTEGAFAVAGGSGNNCVKVFDTSSSAAAPLLAAVLGFPGPVFAVAATGDTIAVGGAFDSIYVYKLHAKASAAAGVVHEGFHPEAPAAAAPAPLTPHHAAAAAEGKAPDAAAGAGEGGSIADRVVAALHSVELGPEEEEEGDAAAAGMGEHKEGDGDYGTRAGVVGGSGLAAVRARRGEGKE